MRLRKQNDWLVFVGLACSVLVSSNPGRAGTLVIDDQTPGTVYDAILDGYPGFYTQDGVPDAGNNSLAVAFKAGATEMRSVAEFPLAPLAGWTSADVLSATLRFNIDDVLGYLGAPLSGCAAENFAIWVRSGDGNIPLSDFNVSGPPTGVVNTGPPCSITDTTLGSTGPVVFELDVTNALKSLLDGGASFANVVWATNSNNTGTSLDNLGLNGAGPPGVRGARMPYLVIELAELPPPNLDAKARRCQRLLSAQATAWQGFVQKQLAACSDRVLNDTAAGKPLDKATSFCLARLSLTPADKSKVWNRRATALGALSKACAAPVNLIDLGPPCDGSNDPAQLADCVLDRSFASAQKAFRQSNALICRTLTAVGLNLQYPEACSLN